MSLKDLPVSERPREKLLHLGPDSLTDAELLAIFLRTGSAGRPVMTLARELLSSFGSLRALTGASAERFCQTPGLGTAKFAQLQAALAMAQRVMESPVTSGEPLTSPAATRTYLKSKLVTRHHEVFACLFLDTRHRVIRYEELFNGTIDGAAVYPREVVRRALETNAAAVILAHNHPSGVAEPSSADVNLTERLRSALGLIDVRVLDHMIVGHNEVTSMAETGDL